MTPTFSRSTRNGGHIPDARFFRVSITTTEKASMASTSNGIVPFLEPGKEGMVHIVPLGKAAGNGPHGMDQGHCHQDGQESQEHRVQAFSDVHHQFGGLQGKQQGHSHEQEGEPGQAQGLVLSHKGHDPIW